MSARRRRRLWPTLIGLAILTSALVWLVGSVGGDQPAPEAGDRERAAARRAAVEREQVARALRSAVRRAATLGGGVEAAVMLRGWHHPVLAAAPSAGTSRWMRMWSMSKVVTMVSLLRAEGWGERPGKALAPEVEDALTGAIERSENCPQRRIVLELQHLTGSTAATRRTLAAVLSDAGASAHVGSEAAPPEPACLEYLERQHDLADPLGAALLLGTSTWRIADAVRFAHALAVDRFGAAISRRVLALMRVPKGRSREVQAGEFTAPPDWGAGRPLADLEPAYKAGWGGVQQRSFLAGQLAIVDFRRAPATAVAVAFHPSAQPVADDPGLTVAPRAIADIVAALRRVIEGGLPRSQP